uniref:Tubulin-specific chaperone A n=1 Tax=Megaselia scalaris TaxID=36166 RepID=T1GCP1_MEGSC
MDESQHQKCSRPSYTCANIATIFELKAKLAMLETYYNKFDEAQTAIEQLDKKEMIADERDTFDNDYFTTKAKLNAAIYNLEP